MLTRNHAGVACLLFSLAPTFAQNAAPKLPDSVLLEENVEYGRAGERPLVLDVLRAKQPSDTPQPAVVFIHGGGWRAGDKTAGRSGIAGVVQNLGMVGFCVGYRLSGEAQWPAQIHDCKAAIRWVRAHAKEYNVDPERIGVWGASAGGHLVALLGTTGDVAELEGECGTPGTSSRVTCVVDVFGPTNFLTYFDNRPQPAVNGMIAQLLGGEIKDRPDVARQASPVAYVTKDDPPFLILHGTEDPLVPLEQSQELDVALEKAGCNSALITVIGAGHGEMGTDVIIRTAAFLSKHLRDRPADIADETIILTPLPSEVVADGAILTPVFVDERFFEGPTWDPQGQRLYFTAFGKDNQQVLRLEEGGKAHVWLDHSQGVNGTFLARDGRILAAQAYGHRILSLGPGGDAPADTRVVLEDSTLNQPNDLCQAPDGTIYFTDPDFKNRRTSAVYRVTANGQTEKIIADMPLPNGLICSLDGRTLYVGDSHEKHWREYPIAADGVVGPGKLFFDPPTLVRAAPDGMTMDEHGTLYFSGRGGVWVVKPDGKAIGQIAVPEFCSSVGFGGADGRTLYLTCSGKVYSLAMKVRGAGLTSDPQRP